MPKILLADDSTHAQRMATKILAGEDIQVVTVSNGEAAVKKLPEGEFDVVLADVFMPGRSGYEVCNFVKSSPKLAHIPVVLVVGQLEPYNQEQGRKVKADAVLKKPFEASDVVTTVREMLQLSQERKPAPPPPPPSSEELQAQEAEESQALEEISTTSTARVEVPADLQQQAAFDLFEESPSAETAPAAPASAAVEAPAPAVSAAEVELRAAAAHGAEPAVAQEVAQAEEPPAAPVGEYAEAAESPATEDVVIPELTVPELEEQPAPAAMAAVAPEPAQHWVAEPERVTDMDRAVFGAAPPPEAEEAPPAEAKEAPPEPVAAATPEPAPAVDWEGLLESVEEPAPVPPQEATVPAASVAEAAPSAAPEPTTSPAPEPVAPPQPLVTEPPQAAGPVPDEAAVRAAVEGALDKAMPNLKAVPGLLDTIVGEILHRLGGAS